jgi:hypothetical protein
MPLSEHFTPALSIALGWLIHLLTHPLSTNRSSCYWRTKLTLNFVLLANKKGSGEDAANHNCTCQQADEKIH